MTTPRGSAAVARESDSAQKTRDVSFFDEQLARAQREAGAAAAALALVCRGGASLETLGAAALAACSACAELRMAVQARRLAS